MFPVSHGRGRGRLHRAPISPATDENHQPLEIRERILNPRKYAKPGRGLVNVTAKEGKTFTGVIRNEDNFSLQLQTLDGRFVFLDKREISRLAVVPEGLMPGDYGSTLSPIELDNLVSYLAHMRAARNSAAGGRAGAIDTPAARTGSGTI